jgi:hypothetical protein
VRFLRAYQETIDWAYEGNDAFRMYSSEFDLPLAEVERMVPILYPKEAFGIAEVQGVGRSVEQGLQAKRIAEEPTAEQLAHMFDILWLPDGEQ